jgi:glycosyltransferase involved in cell wall biosynthesis
MKLTCLIDSLYSGGAQRQLCTLAVLLKQRGMEVSVLTYHPQDFFLPMIRAAGIGYECVKSRSLPQRILALRSVLRGGDQDVVLAFLDAPCLYAELAAIPHHRWGLVVSERSAKPGSHRGRGRWLWKFHRLADYVTTNSHTARLMIEAAEPKLKDRLVTVYNAVDMEQFSPPTAAQNGKPHVVRLLAAASVWKLKNPDGFIEALGIAREKDPALDIRLDWYGGLPQRKSGGFNDDLLDECKAIVEKRGLRERVQFHPPTRNILDLYRQADGVALPSFFEGLSNVVCEAMACGRPVLASNVTDMGNLVKDGYNGFLFDPKSPEDMARALVQFGRLSPAERKLFGERSREMALRLFDRDTFAERYEKILQAAAIRKRVPLEHWLPEVPDSAYRFLESCDR